MDNRTATVVEEERKLNFKVPADLHERIKEAAREDDRSMASWVRKALEDALNGSKTAPEIT